MSVGDYEPGYKIFNDHGYNSEYNRKVELWSKRPIFVPPPPGIVIYEIQGDAPPGFSSPDLTPLGCKFSSPITENEFDHAISQCMTVSAFA